MLGALGFVSGAAAEVEVVRVGLGWLRRAVDGGWMTLFAEMALADDFVFEDHLCSAPRRLHGRQKYLAWYNSILDLHAPHSLCLGVEYGTPESIGPARVQCQLLLELEWSSGQVYRINSIMHCCLSAHRISAILMYPDPLPEPLPPPPSNDRVASIAEQYSAYLVQECPSPPGLGSPAASRGDPDAEGPLALLPLVEGMTSRWTDAQADEEWADEFLARYCSEDIVFTDHTPRPSSFRLRGIAMMREYYRQVMAIPPEGARARRRWEPLGVLPRDGCRGEGTSPPAFEIRFAVIWEWDLPADYAGEAAGKTVRYEIPVTAAAELRDGLISALTLRPGELAEDGCRRRVRDWEPSRPHTAESWRQWLCTSPTNRGQGLCRPCQHNSWQMLRVKRGWVTLRCREPLCGAQWRQRPDKQRRCADFENGLRGGSAGCAAGAACPLLHVCPRSTLRSSASPPPD
eukprot:TRINITY_DN45114_c0_g1_i1.p1 TRINITY_DN45114_c0_g1~~TRINITY_DN45114_c0_g1_i1.p1  ORF type:complete len:459 (+),score=45.96 TRINITY_DN45114_c0_g1_i1:79-1455(+)